MEQLCNNFSISYQGPKVNSVAENQKNTSEIEVMNKRVHASWVVESFASLAVPTQVSPLDVFLNNSQINDYCNHYKFCLSKDNRIWLSLPVSILLFILLSVFSSADTLLSCFLTACLKPHTPNCFFPTPSPRP